MQCICDEVKLAWAGSVTGADTLISALSWLIGWSYMGCAGTAPAQAKAHGR